MKKKTIVIALGGNALGKTPNEQILSVKKAAEVIAELVRAGNNIVVGHGNGPQVGMINLAMSYSASGSLHTPYMPLAECDAMSQGYIGYHLQQALQQSLYEKSIGKDVVSVITQVVVDADDPAFNHPTKPVGMFYSKDEAAQMENENGYSFVEDSERGYRRVVPSPKPQKIVELNAVKDMIGKGMIVITVGGGGIPVIRENNTYRGVDAVIDKDRSCSRLAQELNADVLLILTAVDHVYINFNKPNQEALSFLTSEQALKYIDEGQFAQGSMLPKVEACLDFVKTPGRVAIITSLSKAVGALNGKTGTVFAM